MDVGAKLGYCLRTPKYLVVFCRISCATSCMLSFESHFVGYSSIISASFHWLATSCASFKACSFGRGVLSSS